MIFILGFRTPNVEEAPTILFVGMDGVRAQQICDADPHPRISRLDNPTPRPVKHWTEEAAALFEEAAGQNPAGSGDALTGPSFEEGMKMLEEIERLTALRIQDRDLADDAIAALKLEIERLQKTHREDREIVVRMQKEIDRLNETVVSSAPESPVLPTPQGLPPQEGPAAGEQSLAAVADASEAADAGPDLALGGESLAEADEDAAKPGKGAKKKG